MVGLWARSTIYLSRGLTVQYKRDLHGYVSETSQFMTDYKNMTDTIYFLIIIISKFVYNFKIFQNTILTLTTVNLFNLFVIGLA